MPDVSKIGIISKPDADRAGKVVAELLPWLADHGIEARCDEETASYVEGVEGVPRTKVPDGTDLIILLGGDGTLLSAVRALAGRTVPVFAVNLGSMGFLTAITVDELFPELELALRGEQRVGERRLLHCELHRGGRMRSEYEALNDIVVDKIDIARMIDLIAFVDDDLVCEYKADGLIVSTPTGSTAYSLSAGGPIIFPTVEALVMTPICPHTLTNRPVVLPLGSRIRLEVKAKDDAAFLTIDGQVGEPLKQGDELVVCCSQQTVRLLRPPRLKFFDVLREKLRWGER